MTFQWNKEKQTVILGHWCSRWLAEETTRFLWQGWTKQSFEMHFNGTRLAASTTWQLMNNSRRHVTKTPTQKFHQVELRISDLGVQPLWRERASKARSSDDGADQSCDKAPPSGLWSGPPRRTLRLCGQWPENRPSHRRILLAHVVCLSNVNLGRGKCLTPPSSWETGEWHGRCSLLKRCPPPPPTMPPQSGGRGWGVVGALKGQDGRAHLHEFFSPKWPPPVRSLDRGGRCIVQRCDMTFTQCFCQTRGGWVVGLRFKQEVGEYFASYIHSIESPTLSLAWPTLHLSFWAVFVVWAIRADAAQACDTVAHVEQHDLQRIGVHTSLVGLSSAVHVLHHSAVLTRCLCYRKVLFKLFQTALILN